MIFVSLQQHGTNNELIIICIFSVYTVYLVRHESKGLILFSFPPLGTCLLPWKHSLQAWSFFPQYILNILAEGLTCTWISLWLITEELGNYFFTSWLTSATNPFEHLSMPLQKGCSEFQSAEPLRLESVRGPFSTGCGNLSLTTS